MITNADLTIYNKRGVNKKTARTIYLKTQIRGVNFYTKQVTNVFDQGLKSADLYQIRIPLSADTQGKQYIDADLYKKLSDEEAVHYWTINNGDLFGKGLLEDFEKESEFLKQQYTGKVLSFSDNRRGSLQHWKIGGTKDGNHSEDRVFTKPDFNHTRITDEWISTEILYRRTTKKNGSICSVFKWSVKKYSN